MTRMILFCLGWLMAALAGAGCRSNPAIPAKPAAPSRTTQAATPSPSRRHSGYESKAEADARFLSGLCHELNAETEKALEDFQKAVAADPDNEVLAIDVSTRYFLMKRYDKALAVLEQALRRPNASALLDARAALIHLQMGRTNAAIEANQNALRKAPRSSIGYQNLFAIYQQTGQTNEAARIVEKAARVSNPDADFLVDLSEMYYVRGRALKQTNAVLKSEAKRALDRAAEKNPTNFFVLQKLAEGFARLGDQKQAAAALLKVQALYPGVPTVRERLVDLYLHERDSKQATEQLEGLIREDPTNPQAYYLLGILAFDERRFKDAEDYFHKALLLNPDFEAAIYELSVTKMNQDQPKESLEVLGKAREKFGDTFLVEYFSALAHMRLKSYTNAVKCLTAAEVLASATDTNRLTHIFYFQLGSANERAGRWDDSVKYLRKCLKMSPDFGEALNYLGYMWAEKGTNLVEAREMIEKALKQEPDNAAFLDSLGWVLFKQGQPREALDYIQRAIAGSKEPDATLYDHLGDIQAALGQREKARDSWRKALSLEPTPELRKKLE